jgi:hypothetical protein
MVTDQQLYDFFSDEYVETEIPYLFSHSGPVSSLNYHSKNSLFSCGSYSDSYAERSLCQISNYEKLQIC